MRPDPQFPADLVTFSEEVLNGKLHFLCSDLFRKIPAINTSFAPKYVHFQGWPLNFVQNIKMFQPQY